MLNTKSYHHEWQHARDHFTKVSLGIEFANDAAIVNMQTGKGKALRVRGSALPFLTCKPGAFVTSAAR